MNLVFFGKYFHCISFEQFESVIDGYLAVFEGIVSTIKIRSKLLLTACFNSLGHWGWSKIRVREMESST